MSLIRPLWILAGALWLGTAAQAAGAPDSAALLAAQRQAMLALSMLDGNWRGMATLTLPDGKEVQVVQTERVGSLLDGTLKIVEGRGYMPDGSSPFNAFGVISYSPHTQKYSFRSYAQGFAGDFPIELRPDGFTWSMKAGPATLRYTATVKDGVWQQIGERLMEGQAPVKTLEMKLQRIGPSDWPAAGAVPAK